MNPALRRLAAEIMTARAEQTDAEEGWRESLLDGDPDVIARATQRMREANDTVDWLQGAAAKLVVELSERTAG